MEKFNNVIVGLDLSLTSPGAYAIGVKKDESFQLLGHDNVRTKSDEPWFDRVTRVQEMIVAFVLHYKPKRIFIENYSFGSTFDRETLGEVHGVVLFTLMKAGYPAERIHRVISPGQLKKFATGRSQKVKKKEIVDYVNEIFGLKLLVKDNDVADALVLAYIGYCILHFTQVEQTLNKKQLEVIKKIKETMGDN